MNNLTESILNAESKFNIKKVIPIEKGIQLKQPRQSGHDGFNKIQLVEKGNSCALERKGRVNAYTNAAGYQQIYCEEQKEI